jgi:hypothetical protein
MNMSEETKPTPKVFISYSWSSPHHEKWVLDLAERLVSDGVDVVLDKWELREGQDKYAFMERMVTDEQVSKVLAICDRRYVDKANKRRGGVGTESQIISKEVYEKVDQDKFIAIVTEYDEYGKEIIPTFFSGRIFIDMSTEEKLYENYEQLLRAIYNKPLYVKPAIGTPPRHLFEGAGVASRTAHKLSALKRGVIEGKSSVPGLVSDYLKAYLAALEDYRVDSQITADYDEEVISSIDKFASYRDEYINFITFIVTYSDDERIYKQIFEFFERSLKYLHQPDNVKSWQDIWADNYRFILFELFLYNIAALIESQKFETANMFLAQGYFDSYTAKRGDGLSTYCIFDQYPQSLEVMRKRRLNLKWYYVTADLLRKRAYHEELNFDALIQADFILFLRGALNTSKRYGGYWNARTAGYAESFNVLPLFAKAASRRVFNDLKLLLHVTSKEDLEDKYKAASNDGRISRREHMWHVYTERLINLDNIDTFE